MFGNAFSNRCQAQVFGNDKGQVNSNNVNSSSGLMFQPQQQQQQQQVQHQLHHHQHQQQQHFNLGGNLEESRNNYAGMNKLPPPRPPPMAIGRGCGLFGSGPVANVCSTGPIAPLFGNGGGGPDAFGSGLGPTNMYMSNPVADESEIKKGGFGISQFRSKKKKGKSSRERSMERDENKKETKKAEEKKNSLFNTSSFGSKVDNPFDGVDRQMTGSESSDNDEDDCSISSYSASSSDEDELANVQIYKPTGEDELEELPNHFYYSPKKETETKRLRNKVEKIQLSLFRKRGDLETGYWDFKGQKLSLGYLQKKNPVILKRCSDLCCSLYREPSKLVALGTSQPVAMNKGEQYQDLECFLSSSTSSMEERLYFYASFYNYY